jgi:3D (Asp-Asp-Asp) domain-containing protein
VTARGTPSSLSQMRTTPSATLPAERRRRSARSRRASSPLALAGWAALAAILTFSQLEREEDAAVVAPPFPGAVVAAASPFSAPFSAPRPQLGVVPVRLPAVVSAPMVAAVPVAKPRRVRSPEPKRPFAVLTPPKVAFASPLLMPRLRLPRVLDPRLGALRGLLARARPGEPVAVRLSAYCLRGATRRGLPVRTGIVAADPRVFPLAGHIELYAGGRYLGRYLVDDTGRHIKGTRIDIWTPDCDDARRFGMRDGVAALVATGR